MLYNMKFLCPLISTYICNYHVAPTRLLIFGEGEIISKEGTTQGNPTSKGPYDLGVLQMLHSLLDFFSTNKLQSNEVGFAYDFDCFLG